MTNKPIILLFALACTFGFLQAQSDLSEGWEIKEAERQPPKKIMDAIGVKPGMVIAEIGAGRGRFTVYLAGEVGPSGKILANDISAKSLEYLIDRCKEKGFTNVTTVLGEEDDPLLPDDTLDLAIMVYTYHHLNCNDFSCGSSSYK